MKSNQSRFAISGGVDRERLGAIVQAAAQSAWEPYRDAAVHSEEIEVGDLLSLVDTVGRERLDRNNQLFEAYQKKGIIPFDPVVADSTGLILSPVIEESQHGELIIDGGHRLLLAHNLGVQTVRTFVITSPHELPEYASQPVGLADIEQSAVTLPPKHTRDGLHSANPLFRPGALIVERATRAADAELHLPE